MAEDVIRMVLWIVWCQAIGLRPLKVMKRLDYVDVIWVKGGSRTKWCSFISEGKTYAGVNDRKPVGPGT